MTEAAFPSLVSKVSYDDYPTRPVTNHKAAPASPARGPTQQQRQHAPAVHGQMKTPQHSRHSATADVNQQPSQQQKQAPLRSMPRPPPAQQPQLPDPRWSSSGNSPSQSPRKQPPQKPHSLRSALPPGYMPQARPAGHVPQPRRVAQQPMAEQPAMAAGSQHANGVNRHSRGVNLMPGGESTCCNHDCVSHSGNEVDCRLQALVCPFRIRYLASWYWSALTRICKTH